MMKKLKSKLSRKRADKPAASSLPSAALTPNTGGITHTRETSHLRPAISRNESNIVVMYSDHVGLSQRSMSAPSSGQANYPDMDMNEIVQTTVDNTMAMLNNMGPFNQNSRQVTTELDIEKLRPYRYDTLPSSNSFRLLEFSTGEVDLPSGGQKVCRLVTYQRPQAPPYLCLSYAWGYSVDSEEYREAYAKQETWVLAPDDKVNTEWTAIPVGQNLYRAMKQICKSKSGVPNIWIDALCIYLDRSSIKHRRNLSV